MKCPVYLGDLFQPWVVFTGLSLRLLSYKIQVLIAMIRFHK